MNHNHDIGDIINVAQKGPPKYYQIEKITRTLFLVKKLPIHLVDHRPLPSGDTAYTFWVDWDQATDFQMPQNWVKGPERKYIPQDIYDIYDGNCFVIVKKNQLPY